MPGIADTQNPFREAAAKPAASPPPAAAEPDDGNGGDDEDIDAWEAVEAAQIELKDALMGLKRAIDSRNEDGVMDFLDAAFDSLSMMQDALDDEDFLLDFDFMPMQEVTTVGLAEAEKEYRRGTHTKRGAREHVKRGQAEAEKKAAAIKKKQNDLIAELKKNPKVKDPAALAAWIGMRMGGLSKKEGK